MLVAYIGKPDLFAPESVDDFEVRPLAALVCGFRPVRTLGLFLGRALITPFRVKGCFNENQEWVP